MSSEPRTHDQNNSGLVQFPQPTRPIGSYDMSSVPSTIAPQKNVHDNHRGSQPLQLPHPSKPTIIDNMSDEYRAPGELQPAPPTAATEEEEEERSHAVDELCRAILEIYDRLPVGIQSQLSLDEMKAITGMRNGLKVDSATRGGSRGSVEELKHKLERFKIRTIQLAGVVKEEQKK
ncbi:hypothetical protein FH972_016545 [Carpinus fangiana]|uniref:Uncharacterized protein n=1 Tax=Carpinus fangiana TaxID=176857 RepID=A0A5N6RJ60_9ROSI|nr:hypothetical protein FH972_016545 [Carpinus fangiana]